MSLVLPLLAIWLGIGSLCVSHEQRRKTNRLRARLAAVKACALDHQWNADGKNGPWNPSVVLATREIVDIIDEEPLP